MFLEPLMNRIIQGLDHLSSVFQVVEVESESVLLDWVVQVPTVDHVPKSQVGRNLGRHKLGQSTHTRHSLSCLQSKHQMLSEVSFDWLQIFDLIFVDNDPHDSKVHIEVAHDLASRDHFGNCMVSDSHVGFVSSQRNRTQQTILSVRILQELVAILHSCVIGKAGFELLLEVRIVEEPQGTSIDVIDDALFHPQEERLALIHQYLRDVFIHDNGAFDGVLGEVSQFLVFVDLPCDCSLGSCHFIGLNLTQTILPPHVSTKTDQVVNFFL